MKRLHSVLGAVAAGALLCVLAPAGASATLVLHPDQTYHVATNPNDAVVADVDRDGNKDLLFVETSANKACILYGKGNGTLSGSSFPDPPPCVNTGDAPRSLATGDFNRDGNMDLAVANSTDDNVSEYFGDGDGHFGAPHNFGVAFDPRSIRAADLDDDGRLDLVVADYGNTGITVLMNTGSGNFSALTYGASTTPSSLAIKDVNNDGVPDVVVTNQTTNMVSVLIGDGGGAFGVPVSYPVGTSPSDVVIRDLNDDGKADLAVTNQGTANVSILNGNGLGNFATKVDYPVGSNPTSLVASDLDGDGVPELAVTTNTAGPVEVLKRVGNTTSYSTLDFGPDSSRGSIEAGDFNNDGSMDLVTTFGDPPSNFAPLELLVNSPKIDPAPIDPNANFGLTNFLPVSVGLRGDTHSLPYTNSGSAPLNANFYSTTEDFLVGADTCNSVQPGGTCSVNVTFTPQAEGNRTAVIHAVSDDPDNPDIPSWTVGGVGNPPPSGPKGDKGDTGAQGPQGKPGRNAKVTCKVSKPKSAKKVKVTCRVRLVTASARSVGWKLSRRGKVIAHGKTKVSGHRASIVFPGLNSLKKGRYTLHISGRKNGTVFIVS